MAPSPAAGKASNPPQTPTKPGKNPDSSSTSKLQEGAQSTGRTSAKRPPKLGSSKASTPKASTDSPSLPARTKASQAAAQDVKEKAPETASDAEPEADTKIGMKDNEPEETPGKETQPGNETGAESSVADTSDLEEANPDPVDEGEDTIAGAKDTVDDAADDTETPGDADDEKEDDEPTKSGVAPSGAKSAAKSVPSKTAEDVTEGDATKAADDTTTGAQETAEDTTEDAKAGAEEKADDAESTAKEATDDATETAKDTTDGAKATTQDATDEAKKTADSGVEDVKATGDQAKEEAPATTDEAVEDAKATTDETADDAKATGEETTDGIKDAAEAKVDGATEQAPETEEAVEGAKDTADDAVEGEEAQDVDDINGVEDAEEAVDGVKGDAEDEAEGVEEEAAEAAQDLDVEQYMDPSILKGLEVGEGGAISNADGEQLGQLDEGDPEDLIGMEVGDDGEILDEDGDVVGRVSVLPEVAQKLAQEAKEKAEAEAAAEAEGAADEAAGETKEVIPDIGVLEGLKVGEDGQILDADGNAIGKITEGDPADFIGQEINAEGEVLDDDGDVIGRAEVLPQQVPQEADTGEIDQLQEQIDDVKKNLVPDLTILKDKKLTKKGTIIDEEGETIGKLSEGDPRACYGKAPNENGEILDKDGKVIGKVEVVPGEAADDAMRALNSDLVEKLDGLEGQLGEAQEKLDEAGEKAADAAEKAEEAGDKAEEAVQLPDDILERIDLGFMEGFRVNKKGEVLNEDGDVIAKLSEGELEACKGKKLNNKGEILDSDGNVIGKVELVQEALEEAAEAQGLVEDSAEKPDFSLVANKKLNKKGEVLDEDGDVIAKLSEGYDLADCRGKTIDENGEIHNRDGDLIGKVELIGVPPAEKEQPEEEPEADAATLALAALEGSKVNKNGEVLNEDGDVVAKLAEGYDLAECKGKKLNEKGEILNKDGEIVGKVEPVAQPEEEDVDAGPELPPLSILEGLTCNKYGKIIDRDGKTVGELVEGDPKRLSKLGTECDDAGQFFDNRGRVIGKAVTLPAEDEEEEGTFAGLEGLIVVKDGWVEDENQNRVGRLVEGDPKKLVGRSVDEDGDVIDKRGNVVGHAERYEEPEEAEPEKVDLSPLIGLTCNKQGNIIGPDSIPIGRLVEGNAKECAGRKVSDEGQIFNDQGHVIGRCELIPENEREVKAEGQFAGLEGLVVVKDGFVEDVDHNVVGVVVEGDAKKLIGRAVDEDGDIIDKYGNVKGHADPYEAPEEEAVDLSVLAGLTLNKQGNLIGPDGVPIGRLVEGNAKELVGKRCNAEGQIFDDQGKVVGRCEVIPPEQREARAEGPFAGLEGLHVVKDGYVEDAEDNVVGILTEGDWKKLLGRPVDEDGDIVDRYGNPKGHAEPYEVPEEEQKDLSSLAGKTVNKQGNVVDEHGTIFGHVVEGDLKQLIGCGVDGQGQIWSKDGQVIGKADTIAGGQHGEEGPFSNFEETVVTQEDEFPDFLVVKDVGGQVVGRVVEGDPQKLVGRKVDDDGDILDKNGNPIGRAERWTPPKKEREVSPMAGCRVNKEGEVRDKNGDVIGRLTDGNLLHCIGKEVDDNGNVVDQDGNILGECTLLENIPEEEELPTLTEEEMAMIKKQEEDAETAKKIAGILSQTLEKVEPICKMITEHVEKADRTPKDELDEEELVKNVKPLIEEGGKILGECNGAIRGLDPDGRIAAEAKAKSASGEATPEQHRVAELLKELTTTVVKTIDNAKKRISDMPHAKKKLNPLWGLLTEPLFQIIAAVGLLLSGVLGLVGKLLNGLGLGGLVNGLLGGLGIDKLLGGLGLGSIASSLGLGGGKK